MQEDKKSLEVSYGVENDELPKNVEVPITEESGQEDQMPKGLMAQIEYMKSKGMTNTPEFKEKMIELEDMLGIKYINPFETNEADIFEDKLKQMSYSDMQKMARKVGVNPLLDRLALKNLLRKEFVGYNRNNRRNIMPSSGKTMTIPKDHPDYDKIQKILRGF